MDFWFKCSIALFLCCLPRLLWFIYYTITGIRKYFLLTEKNLLERYGQGSWALITGSSNGQGRLFALELAKRGFNIVLTGSDGNLKVRNEINIIYPYVQVIFIKKDFGTSFEEGALADIEKVFKEKDISILVNNVGHRTAWIGYHNMKDKNIKDTIACGTITQALLCKMAIGHFLTRGQRGALVNITAQCTHPTFGLGVFLKPEIRMPYLSVYEASNVFGYYHSNSLYEEYGSKHFDFLTITPGAVVTENTPFLKYTLFRISAEKYVPNILRLLGNVQGETCAHWGHAFSTILMNFAPFLKKPTLAKTAKDIANTYMSKSNQRIYGSI